MNADRPATPKVIKRYSNRKLYDTSESRYVTLDEIADMVKDGAEVKIIDNRSKEDLTSVTLAQIVFEEEKKKNQMPLSVLREIIRRPGESLTEFIKTEVTPRVASIREEAGARLDKFLGRDDTATGAPAASPAKESGGNPALNPAEWLKASQRTLEDWQRRMDDRVKQAVENVLGNLPALGRDLQALVERIDTLEARIVEMEHSRSTIKANGKT